MTTARSRHLQRTTRPQPGTARGSSARQRSTRGPNAAAIKVKEQRRQQARRQARRATLLWSAAAVIAGALIVTAVLVTRSSPLQHTIERTAPAFTLTATNGKTVSLASYRGHNVVLYFNEGVGCDACFYQMRQFEQHAVQLRKAGIIILPIVMNPASQIRPELASFGLRTPYLIDVTGAVSRAYGVLGKGMHAGLPGHGFVLIDAHGAERWYGEYPSMYLPTAGLIQQVRAHLGT
jgi:peroxiredoxin